MNDGSGPAKSPRPMSRPAGQEDDLGTLIAWQSGSGKGKLWHIVHVDQTALTFALDLSEYSDLSKLLNEINAQPDDAAIIIEARKGGGAGFREKLSRVAYTQVLKHLTIIDDAGKKYEVTNGDEAEQAQIFEAVRSNLGGTASEEDADAWSVIKVSLIAILVTIFAGGVFVKLAADADPNFVAAGRRAGMQQLINNLGVKLGPVWVGVIFAAVALAFAAPMVLRLVNRPKRQVLAF